MKKIVSLALILILMTTALIGCGGTKYKDGTYQGDGEGRKPLTVAVKVENGKIAKVEVVKHDESKGVSEKALAQIPEAIVKKNSPDVDVVSGVTGTSKGIIEAAKNALAKAK